MKTRYIVYLIWAIIVFTSVLFYGAGFAGVLLALTGVSFLQNMSFTWVSRSRQGGDPEYHRYAAWSSNGIWMLTQAFIAANVYTPISVMVKDGVDMNSIFKILLTFIIYALATTEGSVNMMKINLGHYNLPGFLKFLVESGKRKVGER